MHKALTALDNAVAKALRVARFKEVDFLHNIQKIVNKLESSTVFGEMNLLNKAMNMAYFELLGDADLMNTEMDKYRAVSPEDISTYASKVFIPTNCLLIFKKLR